MRCPIERGLLFGNLVPVDTPALVERCDRALKMLTGRETTLPDFRIDISGHSPEVGDAFGDHLHLDPSGANRQFILLTTAQKTAPLPNAQVSTLRAILRALIEENEPQLFALTARDAVAGELDGTVSDLSPPARPFDIRKATVRADTTTAQVAEARRPAERIHRFRSGPDAWRHGVLIAEMIGLAGVTGDDTRNPIGLPVKSFEQANVRTSHFGGLYLFRGLPQPAVVSVGRKERPGTFPVETVLDFRDRNGIARVLERNEPVEPVVRARGVDSAAILHQKMGFILLDAAAMPGVDLAGATRRDLRFAGTPGAAPPQAFLGLAAPLRWVEGGGPWPRITSEHPACLRSLRARPHADRDLVNLLPAELAPLDMRQPFISRKQAFHAAHAGWSDAEKTCVADILAGEYRMDKPGTRAAPFGPEPGMEEPPPAASGPGGEELIGPVGPWGAARRPAR